MSDPVSSGSPVSPVPASTPAYTMWILHTPFNKHGVPVMGSQGRTIEKVVVFRAETFQKMLREIPALNETLFCVGQEGEWPITTSA